MRASTTRLVFWAEKQSITRTNSIRCDGAVRTPAGGRVMLRFFRAALFRRSASRRVFQCGPPGVSQRIGGRQTRWPRVTPRPAGGGGVTGPAARPVAGVLCGRRAALLVSPAPSAVLNPYRSCRAGRGADPPPPPPGRFSTRRPRRSVPRSVYSLSQQSCRFASFLH